MVQRDDSKLNVRLYDSDVAWGDNAERTFRQVLIKDDFLGSASVDMEELKQPGVHKRDVTLELQGDDRKQKTVVSFTAEFISFGGDLVWECHILNVYIQLLVRNWASLHTAMPGKKRTWMPRLEPGRHSMWMKLSHHCTLNQSLSSTACELEHKSRPPVSQSFNSCLGLGPCQSRREGSGRCVSWH